ncbi:MFS transporter [Pseudonocardia kunmingensis]|uniref:MFS transporter n=1 Tax=Pseudonocardia kunmingensis TaxID=630975 RepID=A0A543DPI4_9PSEU|nr:MFS transporter [Pseudonocardia kunmingensis]TQM11203.1 MFS transporter [Pseudonocardia kunmingensis]
MPHSCPNSRPRPALLIGTLCLCGTVTSLQQTLVVPLLADLPHLLDTTPDNASWLVTATLLAGAVATPVTSRLADMFGKRLVMAGCLVVMVCGSLLGALTQDLAGAITARTLQGVGVALIPIGIAIMRDELPERRVPLGVALMSATLAIGAGAGLPLAGWVAQYDWHLLFWITGGAGAVMLVAVLLAVPESPIRTRGAFDYRGAMLLSAALTALLLALSKGGQWGWGSRLTLGCAIGGALVLALWIPLELRVRRPLVDLRIATRPAVLLVNIASVLTGFGMFANMLVTTQLFQLPTSTGVGLGLDTVTAGLLMAPTALVFGAVAPLSALMTRLVGAHVTLAVGALAMGAAYVGRVFLSHDLWQIIVGSLLVSVGTSLAFGAMPALVMRLVPVTETASANGLNTLLRSVGTSTSSAVIAAATVIGAQQIAGVTYPTFAALAAVFWAAGAASVAHSSSSPSCSAVTCSSSPTSNPTTASARTRRWPRR